MSLPQTFNSAGTFSWLCPAGVTQVAVEAIGGGGGGRDGAFAGAAGAGGGGGAFAARVVVPVTAGNSYTVVVGAGGARAGSDPAGTGGSSTFTGDSGVQVIAVGGHGGNLNSPGGAGGLASGCTGDAGLLFSGGSGGNGGGINNGGGGGASANAAGNGAAGGGGTTIGGIGGLGTNGGGSGGNGGRSGLDTAVAGSQPGGGGGGGGFGGFAGRAGADGGVTVATFLQDKTGRGVVGSIAAGTRDRSRSRSGFGQVRGVGSGSKVIQRYVGKRGLHAVANVGSSAAFTGKRGLHAVANVGSSAAFAGKRGLHAVASITRVLVSQVASETLYGSTTGAKARVSQEAVESLVKPAPSAGNRVSQVAVEVLLQDRISLPFIVGGTTVYPLALAGATAIPFIPSATVVYPLTLGLPGQIAVPFIPSATAVYPLALVAPIVNLPFIGSRTRVWPIFSLYNPDARFSAPGNGGEQFLVRLAPNGTTVTAMLTGSIGVGTSGFLNVVGDAGFPSDKPFVVTIDSEQLYVSQIGAGNYRIRARGKGNTTAATHSSGVGVTWGDSYDVALVAGAGIAHEFTASINSTPFFTYPGWLICFDSSQAYLSDGSRYPMHITEVVGVFGAGVGTSGTSRLDGPQPNAICTPTGASDDCPAALSNPARIQADISIGDVAVIRYTNPEAVVLDLGARSASLQSWFGLMRVSATNVDRTFTDPDAYVVDTHPSGAGPGPFSGSVNGEWDPAPLTIGIAPDASDADPANAPIPTPSVVPWTTVTLPGSDRFFTHGSGGSGGYNRTGWPMCCLAVRQGNRRVPLWKSWDWHDYAYVYAGFGADNTYAQLLINRNGIVFDSVPIVELPGPQDIDGPDAVWDDESYAFGASWYVVLFNGPYIVVGPPIGGSPGPISGGGAPGVGFPGPPGGPPGPPIVTVPPINPIEGGSGGNVGGPAQGLHVWQLSGGF